MLFKYLKIMYIFLKHRINPFLKISENANKIAEKFTYEEKQFLVNSCKSEYAKKYLRKLLFDWSEKYE